MPGRKRKTGGRTKRKAATRKTNGAVAAADLSIIGKAQREKFLANTKKIGADPVKAMNRLVKGFNDTFAV